MKEVLCIKKPGFLFKNGTPYGPMYNEVCRVKETLSWEAYPKERYYVLEGYEEESDRWALGVKMFRAVWFVDLVSDIELYESLTEQTVRSLEERLRDAGITIGMEQLEKEIAEALKRLYDDALPPSPTPE